jgi:hypothetical protein
MSVCGRSLYPGIAVALEIVGIWAELAFERVGGLIQASDRCIWKGQRGGPNVARDLLRGARASQDAGDARFGHDPGQGNAVHRLAKLLGNLVDGGEGGEGLCLGSWFTVS